MIRQIQSISEGMIIIIANQNRWSGDQGPYIENHNIYSNPGGEPGDVRFTRRNFEVWNGNSWEQLPSVGVSIGLNANTMRALDWVQTQMLEQDTRRALASKHPMLAQALADLEQAEERYEIIKALVLDI